MKNIYIFYGRRWYGFYGASPSLQAKSVGEAVLQLHPSLLQLHPSFYLCHCCHLRPCLNFLQHWLEVLQLHLLAVVPK